MDDFISRAAAIEAAYTRIKQIGYENDPLVLSIRQAICDIPSADVRPVVCCRDCVHWTKQEASLQGRCDRLCINPTGAWYCANGEKREPTTR